AAQAPTAPAAQAGAGRGRGGEADHAGLLAAPGGARELDAGPAGRPDGAAELRRGRVPGHGPARPEKNEIKPWLKQQWCIPPEASAELGWHMGVVRDVSHGRSAPGRPVGGREEKPIQLRADVRAPCPPAPGRPALRDYEYARAGTANVFCAFEP